ncbi:hypothetical protein [Neisseria musculi]|uniref:Uncharacterized protein n=1 Tax=Neisseria musculi TaxID=1815583 RepID=A0A7H1M999_9NEIS|nr:hypothetical protein [Neisseria musculi]QNT58214.1 hypothetical protein H7A79_2341 [Neisseria musculi]
MIVHHPYALSHRSETPPFVKEEKNVFQGITDSEGRTAVFAFDHPMLAEGWVLRPRAGAGPFGEQFVIRDSHGLPLPGADYALLICNNPPDIYRGYSDAEGMTAY